MTASMFAGCSDAKEDLNERNTSTEASKSETASETLVKKTESKTTSKTTKRSTSSTPIPTQATLKTNPKRSSTTSATTTTTTTATTTKKIKTTPTTTTKFSMTEGAYSVMINEKYVTLGMDITGRINEFGALQATVSQMGDISIYSFEDCKITAQSGFVKQISITGKGVLTDTGLTIGSSKEDVLSKYGDAAYSESIVFVSSGASVMQFNIENDLVTMITLSVS